MSKLGSVTVGKSSPVRIMAILNASPESFYKKSIVTKENIAEIVKTMETDGADFIDVGGMSTAPYLSTMVSEKIELRRLENTIKIIQKVTNLPISVDTCRANVAKTALELGVEIINDITGLKYEKNMINVISKFEPSLILCAHNKNTIKGDNLKQTKRLLLQSIKLAKSANISTKNIAVDPAIGFFRKSGNGPFFTRIQSDWVLRDLVTIQNLNSFKMGFPLLVSVSNKSFLGKILNKKNPSDRIFDSLIAEAISVINGADVIRTHNVQDTKFVVALAQKILNRNKKGL